MKPLNSMPISGRDVLPLVEGGKGISVSNGESAGAWAAAGGVGTVSAVNADAYDETGALIPNEYHGKTRVLRQQELIAHGILAGVNQTRIAHEIAGGHGRIHVNVLWEMGGAEPILEGILEGARGLIHGITCGAGMPYKVASIAARHKVYYYPIVSSGRAFKALWRRAYNKVPELLGGVVYEDPWLAGGHNGLSNTEDPREPEGPYERVRDLRAVMREAGLDRVPILMAGGVWWLSEWEDWIDNPDLGPIAFQFGTRPLLTRESPISEQWKRMLPELRKGDVSLHRFSPTGFYSSAVYNDFLRELEGRTERQVAYASAATDALDTPLSVGARGRTVYVSETDYNRVQEWLSQGYTEPMRTPDDTMIFVAPERAQRILKAQADCMGCLSACKFSNWAEGGDHTTGKRPDPRSFCIQKTLQRIGHGADVNHELMFAGHNVYRFGDDPFYANGHVPTVAELVERICTGY